MIPNEEGPNACSKDSNGIEATRYIRLWSKSEIVWKLTLLQFFQTYNNRCSRFLGRFRDIHFAAVTTSNKWYASKICSGVCPTSTPYVQPRTCLDPVRFSLCLKCGPFQRQKNISRVDRKPSMLISFVLGYYVIRSIPSTAAGATMVKPLAFKGDKKSKKRKALHPESAEEGNIKTVTVQSTTTEAEEDDSWGTADVPTDITGPILFVLPSATPTCIACDANGKVFASEIENIVEGDPATAEPHDVRQVWIASRVAGADEISFKGHHGRYGIRSFNMPVLWLMFLDT